MGPAAHRKKPFVFSLLLVSPIEGTNSVDTTTCDIPALLRSRAGGADDAAPSPFDGHAVVGSDSQLKRLARRKIWFGATHAEYREFTAQKSMQVRVGATTVGLLFALAGDLAIVGAAARALARPGAAVLLARDEPITVVGSAGARALAVYLTRHKLHRLASEAHGDARRVSTAAPWTLAYGDGDRLAGLLSALEALLWTDVEDIGTAGQALSDLLHRAALDALLQCGAVDELLPPSRAVTDAMRRVRERPNGPWTVASLAACVGVTPKYLKHAFHDHLGKGVNAFIVETRLSQAHESLSTARDSRPLSLIANSLGFQNPGSFSRAYSRVFGEPPSATRARAVRASSEGE